PARWRTPPLRVGLTGRGCRARFARHRFGSEPRGLADLVAAGVPHLILQVHPLLERAEPRPPALVRAGAGDAADREQPEESPVECVHLAVPRVGPLADPLLARP